jgi:hypothetical protein
MLPEKRARMMLVSMLANKPKIWRTRIGCRVVESPFRFLCAVKKFAIRGLTPCLIVA